MLSKRREVQNFFWSKKVFLFDLDGTLYLGKKILPGAFELVQKLQDDPTRAVFFFTNNSSRSLKDYLTKLRGMGFAVSADQVVMSTHTLIRFLKSKKWTESFCLGTPAMHSMLVADGIAARSENPQVVVVGFDKTLTYKKLLQASRWIAVDKIPYVVTHPDLFCPTEFSPEPDCGGIALLLEATTGRKPLAVTGKPHPWMVDAVLERLPSGGKKLKRSEIILVGDRLLTDIRMAKTSKIASLMVLTGDSQRHDITKILRRDRPDAMLSGVAALLASDKSRE